MQEATRAVGRERRQRVETAECREQSAGRQCVPVHTVMDQCVAVHRVVQEAECRAAGNTTFRSGAASSGHLQIPACVHHRSVSDTPLPVSDTGAGVSNPHPGVCNTHLCVFDTVPGVMDTGQQRISQESTFRSGAASSGLKPPNFRADSNPQIWGFLKPPNCHSRRKKI